MFVPAFGRASPGRSSVPQCRVHHFTVITVLLLATVASSQLKDKCGQDSANFADQMHTIGSIDNALWAITKNDWNVYKLTPCGPSDGSLVRCMKVDSPIAVDTKWPKLAESAKSEAKATDFTFPVDNSVVMDSSEFGGTVLVMHGNSFKNHSYFGFVFGESKSIYTNDFSDSNMSSGIWISSNEKDKAFRLLDSGQKVDEVYFGKYKDYLVVGPNGTRKNICRVGSKGDLQVRFLDGDCSPGTLMEWSVKKGVLYHKQYYLFGLTKVYIFSEQAETDYTKLQTVSPTDFFHCYKPSTMSPPVTSSNATFPQNSTNSTTMTTTVKGSSSTTIIIIVVVVIGLVVIIALALATYYFWRRNKTPKMAIKRASSAKRTIMKLKAKEPETLSFKVKTSPSKFSIYKPDPKRN